MNTFSYAPPRALHKTVLVVVRESAVRELIAANLRIAGFHPVQADSHAGGTLLMTQVVPDAVVVDIDADMGAAGFASSVRQLARGHHVPIMMLTGSAGESCGADDCVHKPFVPGDLVLRLSRLLGRPMNDGAPGLLVVGPIELDPDEHSVCVRGLHGSTRLALPGAEFKLLRHFMSAPDRVHSREHLMSRVWHDQTGLDPRTVDQNVKRLRVNLDSVGLHDVIETVRGVGYRLAMHRLPQRFA
jgi:two-component system, OmpR family, phosphate regulon response regulator PhoB